METIERDEIPGNGLATSHLPEVATATGGVTVKEANRAAVRAIGKSQSSEFDAAIAMIAAISVAAAQGQVAKVASNLKGEYVKHRVSQGDGPDAAKKGCQRAFNRVLLALRLLHVKDTGHNAGGNASAMAYSIGMLCAGMSLADVNAAVKTGLSRIGVTDGPSYTYMTKPQTEAKVRTIEQVESATLKAVTLWVPADVRRLAAALIAQAEGAEKAMSARIVSDATEPLAEAA